MAHVLLWYKLKVSSKFPDVYWGPMSNWWTNSLTDSMEQSPSSESNQEIPQLVKKYPTNYGTWRLITMITRACHLSLSGAISMCASPHYYTSWRSVLMLSSRLCIALPSGLFPCENPVYTTALPHMCPKYPSHMHLSNTGWSKTLSAPDFCIVIIRFTETFWSLCIWTGVQIGKFIMQSFSVPWYLTSLRPKYFPQPVVLEHPQPLFVPQYFTPI